MLTEIITIYIFGALLWAIGYIMGRRRMLGYDEFNLGSRKEHLLQLKIAILKAEVGMLKAKQKAQEVA
jgi:hypothetical protein